MCALHVTKVVGRGVLESANLHHGNAHAHFALVVGEFFPRNSITVLDHPLSPLARFSYLELFFFVLQFQTGALGAAFRLCDVNSKTDTLLPKHLTEDFQGCFEQWKFR